MSLESGTRFGAYEVVEQIGSGGMGEVWRATDTSLKRDVAIKVLPEAFVEDADRLARFQREAEILASLNHPNIATIHGLEKVDGQTVIIMELVEGPTLADRIAEGALRPEEALSIAPQVADALEAAHGRQIVHRDLKPANIKLRPDGTVKVLDFGISKPLDASAISGGSPVMTTPAVTEMGVILGTAAYMSPEQARGKFVDQRTDIWAFGCLLFEMLTGQPAFGGEDVMATLARVIDRDTDLSSMPGTISPAVRQTIRLCLQKDPRKRISDIRDVRLALDGDFGQVPGSSSDVATTRPMWRRALPVTIAVLSTSLIALIVGAGLSPDVQTPEVNRFRYSLPPDRPLVSAGSNVLTASPDGRAFAYSAQGGMYLRRMDELEAELIRGTEQGVSGPFFSPDGANIGYVLSNSGQLLRVPAEGGTPTYVAEAAGFSLGADWSDDGTIFYSRPDGIFRVSPGGGEADLVIPTEAGYNFYTPRYLADHDAVMFAIVPTSESWDRGRIVVQSLTTGERTDLINGGTDARLVASGHLVYSLDNDLIAVPFDRRSLSVTGRSSTVLQDVMRGVQAPISNFTISDDGTLFYVPDTTGSLGSSTLSWVNRDGVETSFGLTQPRDFRWVRISPDGEQIATTIVSGGRNDIWVTGTERLALSPVTSDQAPEFVPLWDPDGGVLYYVVNLGGRATFYSVDADGTTSPSALIELETNFMSVEDWMGDGTGALFTYGSVQEPRIGLLDMDPSAAEVTWEPFIERDTDASMLSVSPGDDWITYQSDDSGEYGIYIERLPERTDRRRVSDEDGGWAPAWSRDGSELYYRRLTDGAMMAVSIQTSPELQIGSPEFLFETSGYIPLATPAAGGPAGREWDVGPDGRFLMIKLDTSGELPRVIVVQNWLEELKRLVPTE